MQVLVRSRQELEFARTRHISQQAERGLKQGACMRSAGGRQRCGTAQAQAAHSMPARSPLPHAR